MIRKLVGSSLALLMSTAAFAFDVGSYACKNEAGVPDDIYKIRAVTVQGIGEELPFIEATRHFRSNRSDPNSVIKIANIRGIASLVVSDDFTSMTVGAIRLEFINGKLGTCQKL